ncbi:A disintegrin and metalloproteinase with thrombospondin motifs adt-2-like [Aethina tumida]|uniref:A disintegrin and metalloproteinase with thrombospondin motifs adt-2-like n=1 Tax=Aethina tumida TaxID=116153 RepID=UPI0021478693|nr:A disintegrin and metalloproteinase with thrombospondin motifs adt-2-like [Aethina tumida]
MAGMSVNEVMTVPSLVVYFCTFATLVPQARGVPFLQEFRNGYKTREAATTIPEANSNLEYNYLILEDEPMVMVEKRQAKLWDHWGKWSDCSVTCGVGKMTRWRHCVSEGCAQGEKEAQIKTCSERPC